ncbi:arginine--tRNA ligase [Nanoarchaeota archaeon]
MFKGEVAKLLAKKARMKLDEIYSLIEVPPDPKLGDYAFPCFALAKKQGKSPADIANELSGMKVSGSIAKVEATGPYLNFFISPVARAERVLDSVHKTRKLKAGKQKVIVEYPSPNTNKPLHLGHVRNMVIGTTLANILEKNGCKVFRVNLNNDRGIHICKSMLAYKKWGKDKEPKGKPDHFVGEFYVRFQKESEKNPGLEKEAQEMLQAWENNDPDVIELWEKMNNWAVGGFKETYARFNVKFDKEYNESDIYSHGKEIVMNNIKKFNKDETGAIFAPLEKYGLSDKVLLRSDGTSVYMTQDLALTMQKLKDFKPDKQVWIVASEQKLHFQQLFKILEILGVKEEFYHLAYGMVFLPEGRLKSREGRVVDADDLLDHLESMAAKEIKKRDWDEKKVKEVSKKVAMAAVRFYMLKFDPLKDFTYDPEQSVSFEGDTGPYLQYTHARISSILRKGKLPKKAKLDLLVSEEEQALLRELERMPLAFETAANDYKINNIPNQLLSIAHAFNTFYHACPVLKAEGELQDARLILVDAARKIIKEGLEILGIEALEEM